MSGGAETAARPYDMRWGTPAQVMREFGLNPSSLKAAWTRGWVKARQCDWVSDARRTQTIYCFEDIHVWLERIAHKVSGGYVEKWWTDSTIGQLAEKIPAGPYAGRAEAVSAKPATRDEASGFYFVFMEKTDSKEKKR